MLCRYRHEPVQRAVYLADPNRAVPFCAVLCCVMLCCAGTSMNPMLRAAHLAADPKRKVLLVVPWVELDQQVLIYPKGVTFETKQQQADYILNGRRRGCDLV